MSADILKWSIWAGLLFLQNFSNTLISRARNGRSLGYHAICSVFSNGIWFLSSLVLVDNAVKVMRDGDWWLGGFVATFYTTFTVIGSVSGHHISMKWLEKGNRKVGA